MLNEMKMWNVRWAKDTINGIVGQEFKSEPLNSDTVNKIQSRFQEIVNYKGMDMPFSFDHDETDILVNLYEDVDFRIKLHPDWEVRKDGR